MSSMVRFSTSLTPNTRLTSLLLPTRLHTALRSTSTRAAAATVASLHTTCYNPPSSTLASFRSVTTPIDSTATHRLSAISRHFSTSRPRSEFNMASSNPNEHNNEIFQRSKLFDATGRVALVTGGGTGIGLMATQALAVNGAKVYITGRTKSKLDQVAETYGKDIPGQIIPIQADVSSKDSIRKLYEEISSREKCLCILVNNAGIALESYETESKSAEEMKANLFEPEKATLDEWTDTYRTNVAAAYFTATCFLPLLAKSTEMHQGWSGTVLNISSISGLVATTQHHPAYNASKAATLHLTRSLAREFADNNIKVRVNSIAPGVFPSEMTAKESDENQKSHIPKEKYADKVPAARPGKDEDMAQAVLFVALNQYVNGQNVVVDGGYTLSAGM